MDWLDHAFTPCFYCITTLWRIAVTPKADRREHPRCVARPAGLLSSVRNAVRKCRDRTPQKPVDYSPPRRG